MKKTTLVLATLLAAGGAAFAADTTYKSGDTSMNADTTTQSGDTLGAKTRRGAHKMGQAIKDTGHEVAAAAHRVMHPRNGRQVSPSYGGDNTDMRTNGNTDMRTNDSAYDGGRRQRMDSAYSNWQTRQNKS
ncbi:hypothetical protein BH11PSE7_BH11PSE7_30110 [soil metagenome]